MSEDYSALDVTEADRTPSASSGTNHVDLVAELGCTEMRPKVWDLAPGDAMSYTSGCEPASGLAGSPRRISSNKSQPEVHRQREQEELYYVLSGPAWIRIGDERLDVDEGTALRVPPESPRQVFNDTDRDHCWLIIGAPPAENDGEVIGED